MLSPAPDARQFEKWQLTADTAGFGSGSAFPADLTGSDNILHVGLRETLRNFQRASALGLESQTKAVPMFLPIAFLAALGSAGLAAASAFLPNTGVDGTIGAFLALVGAASATVLLGLFIVNRAPDRLWGAVAAAVVFIEVLTGLAAWFLMQDALMIAMAVSAVALMANTLTRPRRVSL